MKVVCRFTSIVFFLFALCTVNVYADNKVYAGVKGGTMITSLQGLSDANNIGLVVGYKFNKSFAVEGEFSTSSSDGDVAGFGSWSLDTYAVYAAGRWGSKAYLKGKAGFVHEKIDITGGIGIAGSDTGLSLGLGAGYHFSDKVNVELEYTIIDEDIDFFSLGVNYTF